MHAAPELGVDHMRAYAVAITKEWCMALCLRIIGRCRSRHLRETGDRVEVHAAGRRQRQHVDSVRDPVATAHAQEDGTTEDVREKVPQILRPRQ